MKRLRKLEGIVEELSGQVELEAVRQGSSAGQSPENMADGDTRVAGRPGSTTSGGSHGQGSPAANGGLARTDSVAASSAPVVQHTAFKPPERTASSEVRKSLGRLVLNDKGRSRYVSSEIWSKINDEVSGQIRWEALVGLEERETWLTTSQLDHLRAATQTIADEELDDSDHETHAGSEAGDPSSALAHQSFIFGYSSTNVDLRPLHPLPSMIPFMWQIYQENVDPIVKILHVPTMNKLIREIRTNLDRLTPSAEALMFSIYYGTVTSMESDEVKQTLGAEKPFLLAQYRFGFEQALAKANFLTDPDITICQAFVLFLILVRRHDKTRYAWTLTSLAIRTCQAIGLHRDGANFPNLSPFEVEMRRRLFWCLSILDLRSAEDQGTDLILVAGTFDTKFPTNLNDTDFGPDTKEPPRPREGATEMTFSLMRYEICSTVRRILADSLATPADPTEDISKTLEEREAHLLDVYMRLEHQYLKDSSREENPLYWMAANITRVIVAKMIMVIYQPVLFAGPMDRLSCRTRNRLFIAAVEILEYSSLTSSDPRYKHWCWLFRTYTPWHVMAYLLLEISGRPWSASVERAWTALNANFSSPSGLTLEKMSEHTAVWLPFKKLFYRAKKHRDAELARLRADAAAALELDLDDRACAPSSTFATASLPGSATSTALRERWRKLVNAPPLPPDVEQSLPSECPHQWAYPPQDSTSVCGLIKQDAPPQTQTSSSGPSTTNTTETNLPPDHVGNVMEAILAGPHFNPADLFSVAFPGDTQSIARDSVFGYSTADLPRHDHVLGSHSSAVSETPLPPDNNPPVWMWQNEPVHQVNQSVLGDGLDVDMNLDDGMDWQNWQETIRGWTNTGLSGAAGGVWENGI